MARDRPKQRPPDLFTAFPATSQDTLIVRYPDRDGRLAYSFADAAERLADSYDGRAADDALLLPYLYLHRHACELNLKDCITQATYVRRLEGHDGPELEPSAVDRRLRVELRHRIMGLVDELDKHLVALGLPTLPSDVRRIHNLLGNTDPRGESFRYAQALPRDLPATQDHIDFAQLRAALRDSLNTSRAASDMLDHFHEGQPIALEQQREFEAEFAREYYDYDGEADWESHY